MSSKENLFISNVLKDRGSPHPIEEMKLMTDTVIARSYREPLFKLKNKNNKLN